MDPPPERLYMGTTRSEAQRFAREGISPGDRYYVHLSLTREAAESHSHQRDTPCVVEILAAKAHDEGCRFFARGAVVLNRRDPGQLHRLNPRQPAKSPRCRRDAGGWRDKLRPQAPVFGPLRGMP